MTGVVASGLGLLMLLLTGCGSDTVDVPDFAVSAAGRAACPALISALPARVDGQARRTTTGSRYAAAWGRDAIILRCGVGAPAGFNRFSACQRAYGVDWFVPDSIIADQSADIVMTTVGRVPAVEVLVPASYRPTVAVMDDLAAVVKSRTTLVKPCQ